MNFPDCVPSSSCSEMVLSQLEHSLRHGRGAQGDECEAGKHLREREAAAEAVGELGKVARQMLGAEVVVRAMIRSESCPDSSSADIRSSSASSGTSPETRCEAAASCWPGSCPRSASPGAGTGGTDTAPGFDGASAPFVRIAGTRNLFGQRQRNSAPVRTRTCTAPDCRPSETEHDCVPSPAPDLSIACNYTGPSGPLDELVT